MILLQAYCFKFILMYAGMITMPQMMCLRHLIKRSLTCNLTISIFTLYVSKFLLLKINKKKMVMAVWHCSL